MLISTVKHLSLAHPGVRLQANVMSGGFLKVLQHKSLLHMQNDKHFIIYSILHTLCTSINNRADYIS